MSLRRLYENAESVTGAALNPSLISKLPVTQTRTRIEISLKLRSAMFAERIERRRMVGLTKPREYRLRRGVTLAEAAVLCEMTLSRASVIERYPQQARPGEIEQLREGVEAALLRRRERVTALGRMAHASP